MSRGTSWHARTVFKLIQRSKARLKAPCIFPSSLHTTIHRKKEETELSVQITDNILIAGSRLLRRLKEDDKLVANLHRRSPELDLHKILLVHSEFEACRKELRNLKRIHNNISKGIQKEKLSADIKEADKELLKSGADIKHSIKTAQDKYNVIKEKILSHLLNIPNFSHPDVPVGGYNDSKVVHTHGSKPEFSFPVLDHMELGKKHNIIDFRTTSIVSGRNFYYLKGAAAALELALIQYSIQKAISKGFHPIITPDIIQSAMVLGSGFNPKSGDLHLYELVGVHDQLCLTGTAEIPLAGMFIADVVPLKKLPMRFVAFGRCFRAEQVGSGSERRGLYRVHQFSKVELFSFTANESGSESEEMLQEMVDMQKEIAEELGFHYRILEMSTEELGASAYHKFDLEVWMPGRKNYGEVCSASNCTDYQSMRLKTTYHNPAFNKDHYLPMKKFVHTVNGTACAVPRIIISLLENYQQKDGSVMLPEVLHPFLPCDFWHIRS